MISTTSYLDSQVMKKERTNRTVKSSSRRGSIEPSNDIDRSYSSNGKHISKISLLHRYMKLLKTTIIAFFLSTCIHIGCVTGYYALYLWLHPDDEGKKNFYSQTSVSQGVNIGGRVLGGGGIQTNHHKSYLFHLVREYYKTLSKLFFVQFSAIYLLLLVLLKFFPEHAKLKEDTAAVFNLRSIYQNESTSAITSHHETSKKSSLKSTPSSKLKLRSNIKLKTRLPLRYTARKFNKYSHYTEDLLHHDKDQIIQEEESEYSNDEIEIQSSDRINISNNDEVIQDYTNKKNL